MAPTTRQKGGTPPAPLGDNITIEGETPAEVDDGAPVVDVAAGDAAPGVEDLQAQLAEERRKREQAEKQAEELRNARTTDQREIADHRLTVLNSAIESNEAKKAEIIRRITEAKEAGDYTAEVNAQAELTEVTLDLKQIRQGKVRLETDIEEARSAPQTEDARLEKWFNDNNIGHESRAWLRTHPEYMRDRVLNSQLAYADTKARADGHAPNSPGYFAALEETLGLSGGAPTQQQETRRQDDTPSRPAPAAPVSRSAAPYSGGGEVAPGVFQTGNGKYRLSAEAREAAEIAGLSPTQYVNEALKLKRGSDGQLH